MEGVDVSSVYVHSAICKHLFGVMYSIDLLSIGVKGIDVSSVYVHSAICDTYWCNVFHRSIVNWSMGGTCILYMCILLYV